VTPDCGGGGGTVIDRGTLTETGQFVERPDLRCNGGPRQNTGTGIQYRKGLAPQLFGRPPGRGGVVLSEVGRPSDRQSSLPYGPLLLLRVEYVTLGI
jgi:hypothetical protein